MKGFAVGRSIFAQPARRWFAGELTDDQFVDAVDNAYTRFISAWYENKEDQS